jgi:excisionase family DNA binding protein
MKRDLVLEKLESIEQLLKGQASAPMDFETARKYIGCSKGHLYHLTSTRMIPFAKPGGKKIWFDRSEVDRWLLSGKVKTMKELEQEVDDERRG